jgi:hypothetical protein
LAEFAFGVRMLDEGERGDFGGTEDLTGVFVKVGIFEGVVAAPLFSATEDRAVFGGVGLNVDTRGEWSGAIFRFTAIAVNGLT